MKSLTILSKTEADTKALGQILGRNLRGGMVIELIGPLGAGKTTLTKAIVKSAGIRRAFSPTFILDSVFEVKGRPSLKEIHHIDFYRIKDREELLTLGLYEYIGRPDVAVIIEWADRFPTLQNKDRITIEIEVKNDKRFIKIQAQGDCEKILGDIARQFN